MDLRTYQGNSMAEALEKVKADLGGDAVILHTRTLKRGGVFGVGARQVVEITASRDPRALPPAERRAMFGPRSEGRLGPPQAEPPAGAAGQAAGRAVERRPAISAGDPSPRELSGRTVVSPPYPPPATAGPPPGLGASLHQEINEIRAMVRELLNRPVGTPGPEPARGDRPPEVPEEFRPYYTRLLQNAVAEQLAREVVMTARQRLDECRSRIVAALGVKATQEQIQAKVQEKLRELIPRVLMEALERLLPPAGPFQIDIRQAPKVVALVGPTGVGKTTTIAKLAAHFKLRESRKVGLITIDTYRIAAVDQLRAYAQIMNLPLEVVFTPDELVAAITQLSDCDLILVDTSGRSHRDTPRLAELAGFLEAARSAIVPRPGHAADPTTAEADPPAAKPYKPLEVHLLLSCTSHTDQLLEVARRFAALGVDGVVFTKLDEAVGAGVILNVASQLQWHMSYLTTGQDVPDDIEVGHRRRIAEMLLGGEAFAASSPAAGETESPPVLERPA